MTNTPETNADPEITTETTAELEVLADDGGATPAPEPEAPATEEPAAETPAEA